MFERVELTNFRKHEALTVDFVPGVNALRAGNEAGKSSLLEAILYALSGATALKEPLADVVTYDKPESSLKVGLVFNVNGVQYTIKRSKSGAELTFGGERITGQREVTKYVESLLGATSDMLTKLMMAKQSSVTSSLKEGQEGTVKLIETLADFDLITKLIDLVQNVLPTGNTSVLEAAIISYGEQANKVIESDVDVKQQLVHDAEIALAMATAEADIAIHDAPALTYWEAQLADARHLADVTARLQQQITNVGTPLLIPAKPDKAVADGLRKKIEAMSKVAAAVLAKQRLDMCKFTKQFDVSVTPIEVLKAAAVKAVQDWNAELGRWQMDYVRTEAMIIKETSCALCGKDLKDVPEVSKINDESRAQLEELSAKITNAREHCKAASSLVSEISLAETEANRLQLTAATVSEYVTFNNKLLPPSFEWTGPTSVQIDHAVANQLADEAAKEEAHSRAVGAEQQRVKQLQRFQEQLAAVKPIPDIKALEVTVAEAKTAVEAARALLAVATVKEAELVAAKAALSQSKAVFEEAYTQVEWAKLQQAKAVADLAEQTFNNKLLKKLSKARPQIADRLWSIILSTVSSYFSSIRGEVSIVSRSDNGFKVNGRPVNGLSGSTLDSLGLSIRVALTKTFLPNSRFLILDEVAAGMDEEREAAMLGMVATCDMDQVIVVTHSELADSFAANVITL